jgi:hypothetical protein
MEYLDKPALDNTSQAHPAFWRGKIAGVSEILKIVSDIMIDNDNGTGTNNNIDIENMRRGLIAWREELRQVQAQKELKKSKA